jgi:hypothetical protein
MRSAGRCRSQFLERTFIDMRICQSISAALAVGSALLVPVLTRADTVDFDNVVAPPDFANVTPGGPQGPTVSYPNITFNGGVILNDTDYAGEATTKPNLYATSDFFHLADNSMLPGAIRADFSAAGIFDSIALDIANGTSASDFTLSAFDVSNMLVASQTILLADFGAPGAVGTAMVSGSGIDYFTVTTAQVAGSKDFAIDTVRLNPAVTATPEFGSVFSLGGLLAAGGAGAWVRRRRSTAAK